MTGNLILVRHGQTEANVERRLDTRLPGARLTSEGLSQAEMLGTDLAAKARTAALVSSQALRARQTAHFVEIASGIVVQVQDGLHEVQAGELEDRSDEESHKLFMKTFHLWHTGVLDARIPGGESAHDVLERYVPVVDSLRQQYLDDPAETGDVVLVSHGAAIRLVAAQLAGVPGLFATGTHLANTQSIELTPLAGGGWGCVRWGTVLPPFEQRMNPGVDDPMG
ncbi:histidine phosphatase family protein [Rhodococcus marinonascens]|uniref:histidine phosphatase family protein n=1 Tax=Rhodococcus marinonascens TaxID=38311 RepID=UPI000934704A|nr:histidine phosphatase family protein [Rhodococcus marinonascens]